MIDQAVAELAHEIVHQKEGRRSSKYDKCRHVQGHFYSPFEIPTINKERDFFIHFILKTKKLRTVGTR